MSAVATVRLIAGREVRQRLRSRLFVGTTLGVSFVLAVVALVPALLGLVEVDVQPDDAEPVVVVVVGPTSEVARAAIVEAVGPAVEIVEVDDEPTAAELVHAREVELAVIEGERLLEPPPDGAFRVGPDHVAAVANALALAAVLEASGLDAGEVADVLQEPALPVEVVGDFDADEQLGRLVLAYLGVLLLFSVLTLYVTLIVNGIIEEKGSRVVELLIAAVPARQLMAGKLLGLGLVGLGQTLVLFAPGLLVVAVTGTVPLPVGSGGAMVLIVGWFLLGYAFSSVVAAALGSLVSRPEEAQAVLTPVSLLSVTGFLVGFFAINDPDGVLASVAGWIPLTAPYVMLVRQLVGSPSVVETAGAVGVTVVAVAALALLAARVYEGGILRTGARVRLREAWRSAR